MKKVLFILGQLDDTDVEWFATHGEKRLLEAGEVLIQHGVAADALFFVLDGEVEVMLPGGKTLARLGAGEILGELSFIDAAPPSATVRATARTRVLAVPRERIDAKLSADERFAARFYRALAMFLSDRLRSTLAGFGYGAAGAGLARDELDLNVLDRVHQAGARFETLLKKLIG